MNRPTKEFTTTEGVKIVAKTYLTGREANEIESVYTKDAKVNMSGGDVKVDGFNPNSTFEATKKTIELLVVSVNGSIENVVDTVLDLPKSQFDEIVSFLNSLTDKKKE